MTFRTQTQLIASVRERSDLVRSTTHITDADIAEYINEGIATLYALIANSTPVLFGKQAGVLNGLGDNKWQLPADFYKLIECSIRLQGANRYWRAAEGDIQEYAQLTQQNYVGSGVTQFYLMFNIEQGRFELTLFPAPTNAKDIFIRYIPSAPELSLGTDTLKFPSDWHQWVILDAAIKCNIREESDPAALMAERTKREKRIKTDVRDMTPATPKTIRRTARWTNRNRYRYNGI